MDMIIKKHTCYVFPCVWYDSQKRDTLQLALGTRSATTRVEIGNLLHQMNLHENGLPFQAQYRNSKEDDL